MGGYFSECSWKGKKFLWKTMILQLYQTLKKEKRKKNQQTVTYLLYILKTFKGFKDKLH